MQVEAVIFDIGNVLIEWQPERYYDGVIGPERRQSMFAEVDLFAMMDRIDAGAPFAGTVEEVALAHPDWTPEIRQWRDNWNEMARPAIDPSVRLLRALRARAVPVFALSNFGAENFPLSAAQFPFLAEFDRRYISAELGLIKPDPAIYAHVEADCGLAPEVLLFADDRIDNIEAARARGWQTHLFEGAGGWAQRLMRAGLLTKEDIR